jgi:hypothetical protein
VGFGHPGLVLAGVGQAGEAPAGGGLVEALVGPFHDHHPAVGDEQGLHLVQDHGQVGDMVQRRGRHDGVRRGGRLVRLELDLTVGRSCRRFGIDPGGLVSRRFQHRDEPAEPPAADLDDPGRGRREMRQDEGPVRGQPAFIGRHAELAYAPGTLPG